MNNSTMNSSLSDVDVKGMQIAFALNYLDDNSIGIYMPKLMSDIEKANIPRQKTNYINSNMIKNKNKIEFNKEIIECNYIKTKPMHIRGMSSNLIPIGRQLFVECLDGDVKKIYYLPFSID